MKPIYGFMHICTLNHWKEVVLDQFETMIESGLYDKVKEIRVGIVGGENTDFLKDYSKVKIMFDNYRYNMYEYPTLAKLRSLCKKIDIDVFYIHTKGITYKGHIRPPSFPERQHDWRKFLEYYIIGKYHQQCIDELKYVDVVGVNWHGRGTCRHPGGPHFAGNFWWSKSKHIEKLIVPACDRDHRYERVNAEFWVATRENVTSCCLNESDINHYAERYPLSEYENVIDKKYWIVLDTVVEGNITKRTSNKLEFEENPYD